MAHDSDGNKMHVGDLVDLPCIITGVDRHEDYINISLETVEPVHPANHKRTVIVNAKQVRLRKAMGETRTDIPVVEAIEASKSGPMKTLSECQP